MRDRLLVILGYTGDRAVVPQLAAIAEGHAEGFMRHSAVLALGETQDYRSAVPALQRVIESDTYARIRFSDSKQEYDSTAMVYSPVRSAVAALLRRVGLPVPERVEVVEARYGVQRLEPLLYEGDYPLCRAVIGILEMIGGVEAKTALQTFVDKETGVTGMESLVEEARKALGAAR